MWTSRRTGSSPHSSPALPSAGCGALSQLITLSACPLCKMPAIIPTVCGCCEDYPFRVFLPGTRDVGTE